MPPSRAVGSGEQRQSPARTETVDRYLETIYYIEHEGEVPRPSRLAEWFGVSAPTVTVSLQRLARDGWVTIGADRSVHLTGAGEEAAAQIVRRHRILECWLTGVLGLDWAMADEEAARLVHGMSDVVLERLDAHLDRPRTCPHGNVIPGRSGRRTKSRSLPDVKPGTAGEVVRISEVAEHEAPQLLARLQQQGLVPGTHVEVVRSDEVQVVVAVAGDTVSLSRKEAGAVWVHPVPHSAH